MRVEKCRNFGGTMALLYPLYDMTEWEYDKEKMIIYNHVKLIVGEI